MILAVDAGNSRIKWGAHDGRDWQKTGWVPTGDVLRLVKDWEGLDIPQRIVVSNVAGQEVRRHLEGVCATWSIPQHWIVARAAQCGVTNGYEQPATLGSDRWAALIAAWRRYRRACVVVNVGTAMTVDAVDRQGNFLGGMIAPGLRTMVKSLAAGTAQLSVAPGRYTPFPSNTSDALYSGVLAALAGVVLRTRAELAVREGQDPLCLISGGDGQALCELLGDDATVVDNLVLDGLIEIAQE